MLRLAAPQASPADATLTPPMKKESPPSPRSPAAVGDPPRAPDRLAAGQLAVSAVAGPGGRAVIAMARPWKARTARSRRPGSTLGGRKGEPVALDACRGGAPFRRLLLLRLRSLAILRSSSLVKPTPLASWSCSAASGAGMPCDGGWAQAIAHASAWAAASSCSSVWPACVGGTTTAGAAG